MKHFVFALLFCCVGYSTGFSQATYKIGQELLVSTDDGSKLRGTVISFDDIYLVLQHSSLGEIRLEQAHILSSSVVTQAILSEDIYVDSLESWFYNRNPYRNLITETAFSLEKGSLIYQNYFLGAQLFSFGVSDRFTMSAGTEFFSLFSSNHNYPSFLIAPKYSFGSLDGVRLAIGSNVAFVAGENNPFISIYSAVTFGSFDNNLTLGLSRIFDDFNNDGLWTIQLGGQMNLSESIGLVSDNIINVGGGDGFVATSLSLSFRHGSGNLYLGASAVFDSYSFVFVPIPLLSASFGF